MIINKQVFLAGHIKCTANECHQWCFYIMSIHLHGEVHLCGLPLMFIMACILCDSEIVWNVNSTGLMFQFLHDFTWVPSSYESAKFITA